MKTYYSSDRIALAGKGWELRNYLKMAVQLSPKGISLADYVQGKCSSGFLEASRLRRGLMDRTTEGAGMLAQPKYTPLRKTPGRRVIPFPLR